MRIAQHEIVRVVQPDFLVNSARIACRYETAAAGPLEPGYYFALWPAKAAARIYDRKVRYFGPFQTPEEAHLVQACAAYLGLVEAPPAVAPRRDGRRRITDSVRAAYAALLQALRQDRAHQARYAARR